MIKRIELFTIIYLLSLIVAPHAEGQYFGQNKVQYEVKDWEFIQSEHFDFYYYQEAMRLAEFAACVAESSYSSLSQTFDYKLIDRIPIIIYRSHNHFTETNTSSSVIPESVGGFTEFFKNRVVLPFDGSYEQFRHVIHHEITHAVMLQFLYGAGPGSILRGISRMTPPIWFIEGLAEYTSIGWNTESDMFVRDATLKGYLPPIPYLQAFLAYKGGQAVLLYLEETYGHQKVTELLQRMRTSRNFDLAWKRTLNESLKESDKKWQRYMRKKYWPEIANRKEPSDYAQALTDNMEWKNFVNNSPAVSPSGDRVAFLTDRSGYFDIYLVSSTDKKDLTKLVSGQKKADLEELQWLNPGMSWSPDGKYLAFTSRAAGEDALNILDVEKKEIEHTYKFKLDGLFAPAWSPVSDEIAFIGVKNCCSDIYVYHMAERSLRKITDDIFSDMEPSWSPDGSMIAFASDRKENVEPGELTGEIVIENHDYHSSDIYLIHADGSGMRRITNSPLNEKSPYWTPDGDRLLYISDKSGIGNIYHLDLKTGEEKPLTNLITGCAQLSWGNRSDRLAFTAFSNGGYNIYIWPDPFQSITEEPVLQPTAFIQNLFKQMDALSLLKDQSETAAISTTVKQEQDFSRYAFDDDFSRGVIDRRNESAKNVTLAKEDFREESGEFKTKAYKPRFSIDNAGLNAGYDPIFGFYGLTQLSISDVLGDHQMIIGANIIQDFANSDLLFAYQYMKHRVDLFFSTFQFVNFYATNLGTERFANRGIGMQASYPFSRFRRVDMGMQFFNIKQDNLTFLFLPSSSFSVLMPSIAITSDNSLWGYTSPANGGRNYFGITGSPRIGANGKQFITGSFDYRQYFPLWSDYSFAIRLAGGASFGKNPTVFIMGGVDNWLNYRFSEKIDIFSIQDYFLSNWMTPLRGADYYQMLGSRAALLNMELRFPLIEYLITRFPLHLGFSDIQGLAFLDAGSAWSDDEKWRFTAKTEKGDRYVRDILTGFGYGIRANVYFFLLKFDSAWRTDFNKVSSPVYYFSIGVDF